MTRSKTRPVQHQPYQLPSQDAASVNLQFDPSLLSLAAHVQAHHAQAQAQTQVGKSESSLDFGVGLDSTGIEGQIDPTLFQIEEVVNDVRKGKIRLDEIQPPRADAAAPSGQVDSETGDTSHHHPSMVEHNDLSDNVVPLPQIENDTPMLADSDPQIRLDDEIDPTLREIVNSLTNAQQSTHVVGPGLSHAQAAAAIGAHLTDAEERDRLQQSLQTTLEDLTHASFSSFFPGNFAQSPSQSYLDLNHDPDADQSQDVTPQAGPSNPLLHDPSPSTSSLTPARDSLSNTDEISKRGRGRPKGSRNKHRVERPPRPPKPPGPPKKPKGRPPKIRSPEEQADYELRRHEKSMGIKRQKGRPRKFPGYLVREMRLKKNREEFNALLRSYDGQHTQQGDEDLDMDMDVQLDIDRDGMESMMSEFEHQHAFDPHTHGHPDETVHEQHLHHQDHAPHPDHSQTIQYQHDPVQQPDFSNWSVQDSQTLLEAVGVGVGVEGDHHDIGPDAVELLREHEGIEGVFGLPHGVH